MQKVVGSSPIIRSQESPGTGAFLLLSEVRVVAQTCRLAASASGADASSTLQHLSLQPTCSNVASCVRPAASQQSHETLVGSAAIASADPELVEQGQPLWVELVVPDPPGHEFKHVAVRERSPGGLGDEVAVDLCPES
jgi:hypothetical protein